MGARTPLEGELVSEQLTQVRPARPGISMASIQCRGRSRVGEGLGWQAFLSSVGNCYSSSLDAYAGGPGVGSLLPTAGFVPEKGASTCSSGCASCEERPVS